MMSFTQLSEKISDKGFRRSTAGRTFYDENGNEMKVYDFEHRKKLNMFSVYLDEFGLVKFVEYTDISFDRETHKCSQKVTKFESDNALNRILG